MSISVGGASVRTRFDPPIGSFCYVAHANDPGDNVGDWLECNGQNVSRTTYANLFAKISVTHGAGDGSTTFTLPDHRRRSSVGKGGAGTATLGNAVGNTGGEETHTLTNAEAPALTHNHGPDTGAGVNQFAAVASPGGATFATAAGATFAAEGVMNTTANTTPGGGGAHNTYHPALVCGVWIKT